MVCKSFRCPLHFWICTWAEQLPVLPYRAEWYEQELQLDNLPRYQEQFEQSFK